VMLYAHNEGSSSPNTCALSISDGTSEHPLSIDSDLETNGGLTLYVSY